jgi:hypothetical protein
VVLPKITVNGGKQIDLAQFAQNNSAGAIRDGSVSGICL